MELEAVKDCLLKVSAKNDSDLFLFCAEVNEPNADAFIHLVRTWGPRKKNISLILTTDGGDPNSGYRIVRAIRRYYESFTLYVLGYCKSTGTLMALAADKIVMGDFGELGPLDVQLAKEDEMLNTSGFSFLQSLASLNEQIFRSFESSFLNIKQRSGFTITTKTAAEIASKLAVGLISPISAQLDPVRLGEVQRAIRIASAYGQRLCEDDDLVSVLIAGYPSHGFVIDFEEAEEIFENVFFIDDDEAEMETALFQFVRKELDRPIILNLTKDIVKKQISGDSEAIEQPPVVHQKIAEPDASLTDESPANRNGSETKRKQSAKS